MESEVAKGCDNSPLSDVLEVVVTLLELQQDPVRKLKRTRMRFWVHRGCLTSTKVATCVVSRIAQMHYRRPVPDRLLTNLVHELVEFVSLSSSTEKQLFLTAVIFQEEGQYLCEFACQEIGAYEELLALASTCIFLNPRVRRVARSKLEEPVCCSICLHDISAESYGARLPCLHVFHCDCVVKWLRKHNTCPLCRFEL